MTDEIENTPPTIEVLEPVVLLSPMPLPDPPGGSWLLKLILIRF